MDNGEAATRTARRQRIEDLLDRYEKAMQILGDIGKQCHALFDEQLSEINGLRTELDIVRIERDQLRRDANARVQATRFQEAIDFMGMFLTGVGLVIAVVGEPVDGLEVLPVTTFTKEIEATRAAVYDAEIQLIDKFPDMKFDFHLRELEDDVPEPPAFAFLTTKLTWNRRIPI